MKSINIALKMSIAFWPNAAANESANVTTGNAAVNKLTLGELLQFYTEVQDGPTYCMVTRRVQEILCKLPPHIEDKKARAAAAISEAKSALLALNTILE